LTGPRWRRPDIILERTPGRGWSPSPDPAFRGSTGGPGLLLSRRKIDARIDLAAALPGEPRTGLARSCIQRPKRVARHVTWAVSAPFLAPRSRKIQGKKTLHPQPRPAAEWSFWNPLGATGGDPNTLAPNRRKA